MRYPARGLIVLLLSVALPVLASPEADVADVLDRFHRAAAEADFATYQAQMTTDVVFLGTDAGERWQGEEFIAFARPHFESGRGWTYRVESRRVQVGAGGRVAWFDETLDNDKLGLCRGSGVLLRGEAGWQIAQYNLSMPVPNEMIVDVAEAIEAGGEFNPAPVSGGAGEASMATPEGQAEAAAEEPDEPADSRPCPRRHKTNRRADC